MMTRTILGILMALHLGGLMLAETANAQLITMSRTRTATIATKNDPVEAESLLKPAAEASAYAPSSIDYAERPRFVWVAYLDDPATSDRLAPTLPDESMSNQVNEALSLVAFNPSHRQIKIRIQLLNSFGEIQYENEFVPNSLHLRTLIEPDVEDSEFRGGVIVVSSDAPIVLSAYFMRVELSARTYFLNSDDGYRGFAYGQGFGSESRRTIPFQAIDCDDPDTIAVCNLPMATALWSETVY